MQGIQLSLSLRFCYFLHFLEWFLGLSSKVTKYQIITPTKLHSMSPNGTYLKIRLDILTILNSHLG